MNENDDSRHDPEAALLHIKTLHRSGDVVAADDADDDTREFVRIINAKQAEERQAYAAQQAAKRAAGRYTLSEAAQALADGAGERLEVMLQKLVTAAAPPALVMPTFEPGRNARMDYGAGDGVSSRVRDFYEEVFWDDLNRWLSDHERRIRFRFPDPSPEPEPGPKNSDVLIPWQQAAGYLTSELIPDTEANRVRAIEAYSRTHPGHLPPLLDGKEGDRAYLAVMRTAESKWMDEAIQIMIKSGALHLFAPGTNLPTNDRTGALVSTAQVLQLMRDGRHKSEHASELAAVDDGPAQETPAQRQARRYQMCVDAGLVMPTNDYASLPRGVGKLADREGIARQSFSEDLKAHIRRLFKRD